MTASRRLYFDQAATSWPKMPEAVLAAEQFIRDCGATSGRGSYASARTADTWLSRCRHGLARMVGAQGAEVIALCNSGTHALNALLLGSLRPGDHVVTTAIEHNSVLRPLEHLRRTSGIKLSIAPCDRQGLVDCEIAKELLRESTRAVVLSHASNVTGRRQELRTWGELCRASGAWLLVDASQTLGYVPIAMDRMGVDGLASAGHKGLGALPGSGFIAASAAIRTAIQPILFGGTGTSSEQLDFVPTWPQSVEVGNLNLPAAVSMAVAAEAWIERGETALQSWQAPLDRLLAGLFELQTQGRLEILGRPSASAPRGEDWLPIVSLRAPAWDCHDLSAVLDSSFGIETRAGFHCAALVHSALGTHEQGGTLRISLGHATTADEVDELLMALGNVL